MLEGVILVSPVLAKGVYARKVALPKGRWKYLDGYIYKGGLVEVDAPIDILPYFVRVNR